MRTLAGLGVVALSLVLAGSSWAYRELLSERSDEPIGIAIVDTSETAPNEAVALASSRVAEEGSVLGAEPSSVAPSSARSPTAAPDEAPTELASYQTRYQSYGRLRGRAHNVELAASNLDGAVIPAGGTFSFNDRVGARDRAHGFRRAPVIDGGEIVDGMGGGVCQVASTLHAAALEAGLDVVEQRPHSRPSHYIPMGFDATVVYPEVDLVLSNPYAFPVTVHAHGADGTMVVELEGAGTPHAVEIERHVLARTGYREEVVPDPSLPRGERVVEHEGIRGARVEVVRTVHRPDGVVTERAIARYPSNPRVVRVGTGA